MRRIAYTRAALTFLFIFIATLGTGGCAVRYVADYDASIKEEIIRVAKKVDLYWGALLDMEASQRKYDKFKDQYNQIETDIRGLVMRNEIRPLNKESTRQANIALDLWIEDRKIHKQNGTMSDVEAKNHRKQYMRVFIAMAKGEEAKNLSGAGGSGDPKGENK